MAKTTIFENLVCDQFVFNDSFGFYVQYVSPAPFVPIPGQTYEVVWNGVSYRCVAQDASSLISGATFVGNAAAWGLEGNDEPFLIGGQSTSPMNVIPINDTEPSSYTISIYQVDSEEDVIIHDRLGSPVEYSGVGRIRVETTDGGTTEYINCDIEAANVSLDFSKTDTMTITPANGALFDEVNIPKPVNLLPEYIAEGIDIAGVSGSFAGGSGTPDELKPIRFYDPYGNVLYGYTKAEIQELEELPEGPALSGLVFDRWTHTLDELKATTYFADVGPMYKYGSSPATVLIVETVRASTSIAVRLYSTSKQTVNIYWGDGSSSSMTFSSSYGSSMASSHTYATAGEYAISIVHTSTYVCLGSIENTVIYNVLNNSGSPYITTDGYMNGTTSFYLKSVLMGSYTNVIGYTNAVHCIGFNSRLKFISYYFKGAFTYDTGRPKQFIHCPGLKAIAGNASLALINDYTFFGDISLQRIRLGGSGTIAQSALVTCDGLEEVEYASGAIGYPKMNVQWAMLMTSETPPTISATSPVWGTKPIYVPDAAVDTYKTADGWSTVADYILPASQYHKN